MQLPEIDQPVRLWPAPLPGVEAKPGRPLPLRRVQDGPGNYGRFLPESGAERVFDLFWAARLRQGDVVLSDPRAAQAPGAAQDASNAAPAPNVAPPSSRASQANP